MVAKSFNWEGFFSICISLIFFFICSEYMTYVLEALELEDTVKNYERRHATGW